MNFDNGAGVGRGSGFAMLALALSACAAPSSLTTFDPASQGRVVADANVMPENYRSEILAFLRTYLNDPTKIRTAFISEPALRSTGREERYGVCLRFNARKTDGQYEGARERVVFFLSGKLDAMAEARREQCAGANYQPFPELEALTR